MIYIISNNRYQQPNRKFFNFRFFILMHILFSINHPSQYHMFKHLAKKLVNDNHKVIFFIQSRGFIEDLIKKDGFTYRHSAHKRLRGWFKGKYGVPIRGVISLIQQELRILWYCITHKVDFLLGTDIAIAHVGFLLRKTTLVFTDDDYVFTKPYCNMAYPFARHIVSPTVTDANKWQHKKIAYYGTQKTAYLHPAFFTPDETILEKYELINTRFFIIRLVSYKALHDTLHSATTGITDSTLDDIVQLLSPYGKIIISKEDGKSINHNGVNFDIEPQDMHSLMFYADLFIGDSQSMYIEALLMGTPAIRTNKWVDAKDRVNVIDYIESEFDLGISVSPGNKSGLLKAVNDLLKPSAKRDYLVKRNVFFQKTTNLTLFLEWFLTNYPNSYKEYIDNKKIVDKFK